MTKSLPCKSRIRIRQFRNSRNVIDTIDIFRYPRSSDIPIIILQSIEINKCHGHMPIFAVGRVGCLSALIKGVGRGTYDRKGIISVPAS